MGRAFQDKTNERFGSLIAIRWEKRDDCTWWFCKCDCGNTKWVRGKHLDNGTKKVKVISCGCSKSKPRSHGLSKTTEHKIWLGIRKRCYNPKAVGYCYYGAKGIKVCKRWSGKNGFQNFLDDMGNRPSPKHSIDRIDNRKDYSPSNCRWVTAEVQNRSRVKENSILLTFEGKTHHLSYWSKKTGIDYHTLRLRVKRGLPVEAILSHSDLRSKNGHRV